MNTFAFAFSHQLTSQMLKCCTHLHPRFLHLDPTGSTWVHLGPPGPTKLIISFPWKTDFFELDRSNCSLATFKNYFGNIVHHFLKAAFF